MVRRRGCEVPVLYRTLGCAPAMLNAWVGMAWPLRNDATTSRGLRELVILRVAQLTDAPFEWVAHHDVAVAHGNDAAKLAALREWATSDRFSPDEREVLAMTDEVTRELDVSDTTWAALSARYDPAELVELVLTAAFYCCVSRVLRSLRVPLEDPDDARLAAF
jgi:alkylhydroperoxidase family enzyme